MSNTSGLAKRLTADAPAFAASGAPARPKVMRRPNQFAAARPAAPVTDMPSPAPTTAMETALPVPTAAANEAPASTPWQDDARFGAVLVLVLLAVNAALLVALPYLNHGAPAAAAGTAIAAGSADTAPAAPITLYTKPAPSPLLPNWGEPQATHSEAPVVNILGGEPTR